MLILTNLSTLGIGGQQVHHFNTRYQNLLLYTHVSKFRSFSVDWGSPVEVMKKKKSDPLKKKKKKSAERLKRVFFKTNILFGGDWTPLINGLTNDIHNPAQGLRANWNSDGGTSVQNLLPTHQTFSTIHSNGADCILPCKGK